MNNPMSTNPTEQNEIDLACLGWEYDEDLEMWVYGIDDHWKVDESAADLLGSQLTALIQRKVREAEQDKFEILESLCKMYEQYCSGTLGHNFMSAGESAIDILDKYNLSGDEFHIANNWEDRLATLKKENSK